MIPRKGQFRDDQRCIGGTERPLTSFLQQWKLKGAARY